jgi:hypothetical protein
MSQLLIQHRFWQVFHTTAQGLLALAASVTPNLLVQGILSGYYG